MNRIYWIPCMFLLFLLPACLTVETILTRIIFDKNTELIRIIILYENISSAESDIQDVEADLKYLIDQVEDEAYLLERLEQGFYIKKRRLFVQEQKIMAEEELITRDPEAIMKEFNLLQDSLYWKMPLNKRDSDFEVVSHNGELFKTETENNLRWPKDIQEITWKSQLRQLPESFEKNRKKIVEELDNYLKKTKKK